MIHESVLLTKSMEMLDIREGDVFLDCTLGNGGHTLSVCQTFGDKVKTIALDLDADAINRSWARLEENGCAQSIFVNESFRNLDKALDKVGVEKVSKVLFDLGLSSNQLEESGRGFSFQRNEPLFMTFKRDIAPEDLTAREIVNTWKEESLRDIFRGFGEENYAGRIARRIVEVREVKPIETTFDLVEIIKSATPFQYHKKKIHPATRVFQALRIAVNDELGALEDGLKKAFDRLTVEGRIAVITFHSLEDRIVKRYFKTLSDEGKVELLTKKPQTAEKDETEKNPRSRSAKLRGIVKLA